MIRNRTSHDYDLIVIGAGSGGLTAAIGAAGFGAKVLLVEQDKIGGDCTNYGCVPSKTIIKAANVMRSVQEAKRYGLAEQGVNQTNIVDVLEKVQDTINYFAEEIESVEQIRAKGVDVVFGRARFASPRSVLVNDKEYSGRKIIIATGSSPQMPEINGLSDVVYSTNKTIFLPRSFSSILIYGAGPIGAELGQAFNQLGVDVTIVNRSSSILRKEDPEASQIVYENMLAEGVDIKSHYTLEKVWQQDGHIGATIHNQTDIEDIKEVSADVFLVATGRIPNVDLNLEAAEIQYSSAGIKVNDKLQTTNRNVYAIGDVIGEELFTHVAHSHAKTALTNALLGNFFKAEATAIPRVTFTSPEIASIGESEIDLRKKDAKYIVLRKEMKEIDKAITDSSTDGFIKVLTAENGTVLGATIVGEHAGELIGYISYLMKHKKKITSLSDVVLPYPTVSFGLGVTANQYRAKSFIGWQKNLLSRVLGLRGYEKK